MNKFFYLSLLSAALLSAMNASASSVSIITDTESLQQRNSKQYFSQDGLSGEEAKLIPGAGAGMPLKAASKILIPSNWKIIGSGDFDTALISWRGNLTWPQILRDIAQREKIYISLDWVQKTASINVPAGHTNVAIAPAISKLKPHPEVALQKKPEPVNYDIKTAQVPTKSATGASAMGSIEQAKKSVLAAKSTAANTASVEYIQKLEQERKALIEKNNAAILEVSRKSEEIKALQSKYAVVDPTGKLPPSMDAAEVHRMYKTRTVLPFNPSFEYFMKGGHADRFTSETPATFIAKSGTVESIVMSWADAVGYGVEYRAGVQHHNDYEIEIKGSFIEATTELIRIFEDSDRPLNVEFFPDVRVSDSKKGLVIISDLRLN